MEQIIHDPITKHVADVTAGVTGEGFALFRFQPESWWEDTEMITIVAGCVLAAAALVIIPETSLFRSLTGTDGWIEFFRTLYAK